MNEQGCSEFSSEVSERILDRIAGLEKIITPVLIDRALFQTDKQVKRECLLNNKVMLWVVVAMGLFTDLPIRQVFKACRRIRHGEETPARSSLCMARQRLGSEPVVALHELVVQPLATQSTPGAFYRGMRKVGIDGTVLDAPDCEAHQHLGRSSGGRGQGGFPQVRKVSLVELGTHIEFAFTFGGWKDSERKLVEELWKHIPEDALLIEDRGFFSFEHWKKLHEKHKLLVRIQKAMILVPITRFADGSFLAKVYPNNGCRNRGTNGIEVRVVEYTIDDPQRVGHKEVHRLMTNLLNADAYPAMELVMLYHERWEEELVFDEQKTHHDPCRAEKTTNLRSETTDGLKQELYAMSLGYFVIRAMMFEAATNASIDVDLLSFKGSFQIIKTRLAECHPTSKDEYSKWCLAVIWEISQERIPPRSNRINPRVIKRKMSKWNKCLPEHRKQKPLAKHFAQAVVMLH
jgi:hypothetical protein